MSEIRRIRCDVQGPGCLNEVDKPTDAVIPTDWSRTTTQLKKGEHAATLDYDVCTVCGAPVLTVGELKGVIEAVDAKLQSLADVDKQVEPVQAEPPILAEPAIR